MPWVEGEWKPRYPGDSPYQEIMDDTFGPGEPEPTPRRPPRRGGRGGEREGPSGLGPTLEERRRPPSPTPEVPEGRWVYGEWVPRYTPEEEREGPSGLGPTLEERYRPGPAPTPEPRLRRYWREEPEPTEPREAPWWAQKGVAPTEYGRWVPEREREARRRARTAFLPRDLNLLRAESWKWAAKAGWAGVTAPWRRKRGETEPELGEAWKKLRNAVTQRREVAAAETAGAAAAAARGEYGPAWDRARELGDRALRGVAGLYQVADEALDAAQGLPVLNLIPRGYHTVMRAVQSAGEGAEGFIGGLLRGREIHDAVFEEAQEMYPDDPERAAREAAKATAGGARVTWSGPNAVWKAARRNLHGEHREIVKEGNYEPAKQLQGTARAFDADSKDEEGRWHLTPDNREAVAAAIHDNEDTRRYFEFATQQLQRPPEEVAEQLVNEGIPGEQSLGRELMGQLFVDPLDWVPVGLMAKAGADSLAELRHLAPAVQDVAKVTDVPAAKLFDDFGDGLTWFDTLTPRSKARLLSEDSGTILRGVLSRADPEDYPDVVKAFAKVSSDSADEVEDALNTLEDFGIARHTVDEATARVWKLEPGEEVSLLESARGKRTSYFLRQTAIDPEGTFRPEQLAADVRDTESVEEALMKIGNRLDAGARDLWPSIDDPNVLVKLNNQIKGFYARWFHMGFSPGWAWRNLAQNVEQAMIDGVFGWKGVDRLAEQWDALGIPKPLGLTRGISGAGGPAQELYTASDEFKSVFAGVEEAEGIADWLKSGPVLEISGRIERKTGENIGYEVARRIMRKYWRPGWLIPQDTADELVDMFGQPQADHILGAITRTLDHSRWESTLDDLMEAGDYEELWRQLPSETVSELRRYDVYDAVQHVVDEAESPEDLANRMDDLVSEAYNRGDELTQGATPLNARAREVAQEVDEGLREASGGTTLPHPITEETYQEGQERLASIHRRIAAEQNRAAYYASQSDMAAEFIDAYDDVQAHGNLTRNRVRSQLDRIVKDYLELKQEGKAASEEASILWETYFDYSDQQWMAHQEYAQDAFRRVGDLARQRAPADVRTTGQVLDEAVEEAYDEAEHAGFVDAVNREETRTANLRDTMEDWGRFSTHAVAELPYYRHERHVLNTLRAEGVLEEVPETGEIDGEQLWEVLVRHAEEGAEDKGLQEAEALARAAPEERPAVEQAKRARRLGPKTYAHGIQNPSETFEFHHEVRELDDLVASHKLKGEQLVPNEGTLALELQERTRERAASRMQVQQIGRNLQPDMLIDDAHALDRGSPIVTEEGHVVSGNGRTLGLQWSTNVGTYEDYRNELLGRAKEFGLSPKEIGDMDAPVLVRVPDDPDVDVSELARESNMPVTLAMSAAEEATSDIELLNNQAISNLEVGRTTDIESALWNPANKEFVDSYLSKLPETEAARLVDDAGKLNRQGITRLKWAMFQNVYGGEAGARMTHYFLSEPDPVLKNIQGSLMDALPQMARSEGLVEEGARQAELSLGGDLAAAVDKYLNVKQDPNMTVSDFLSQPAMPGMGGAGLTDVQRDLLEYINTMGLRSKKPLRGLLKDYAEWVVSLPDTRQAAFDLGGLEEVSKSGKLSELAEEYQPEAAGPLFEDIERVTSDPDTPSAGARLEERAGRAPEVVEGAEAEARRRDTIERMAEAGEEAPTEVPAEPSSVELYSRLDSLQLDGEIERARADEIRELLATGGREGREEAARLLDEIEEAAPPAEPVERTADEIVQEHVEKTPSTDDAAQEIADAIDEGELPPPHQVADAVAPEIEDLLRRVQADVVGRWGETAGDVDVENMERLREIFGELSERAATLGEVAGDTAVQARDFALHNYSRRLNVDQAMGFVWMYPFWYSRTYAKYARRLIETPGLISRYARLTRAMDQTNEKLPDWWADQIHFTLPDWLGGSEAFVPVRSILDPLEGLSDAFRSREKADVKVAGLKVGKYVQELGTAGMTVHSAWPIILGLAAAAHGDREGSRAWFGFQSQMGRAFVSGTAALRETWPEGFGKVIPPGGLGAAPNPDMWRVTDRGVRFEGSLYDSRRIGTFLATMAEDDEISWKEAEMAAYVTSGPIYDQALQNHAVGQLMPRVLGWAAGPAFHPRSGTELEVSEMWSAVMQLYDQQEDLTPDEYSAAWRRLKRQYPMWYTVQLARLPQGPERDEAFAWSVINRLPPGWRQSQTFTDEKVEGLLREFYDTKGNLESWPQKDRMKFMGAILSIANEYDYPQEEDLREWEEARTRSNLLEEDAKERFGEDIYDVQGGYFETEDRDAYLEEHPQLKDFWSWIEVQREQDPLLREYYVRPPEHWTQSDAQGNFIELWMGTVPPGETAWDLKEDLPLLNALQDYELRQTLEEQGWTVEQYRTAIGQIRNWTEENSDRIEALGPPEEWERARGINDIFHEERDQYFPDIAETQDRYFDLESYQEKEAFRNEHPELVRYWEWREQFAGFHQLWAKYYASKYYRGDLGEGPERTDGEGGRRFGGRGGGRGYSGGGRGSSSYALRSWDDFMQIAGVSNVRALFDYWAGEDVDLSGLKELHESVGWNSFNGWLTYLRGLYRKQFKRTRPSDVPYVYELDWIESMRQFM